eukprot:1824416-Prymnesium_polylepis.1
MQERRVEDALLRFSTMLDIELCQLQVPGFDRRPQRRFRLLGDVVDTGAACDQQPCHYHRSDE